MCIRLLVIIVLCWAFILLGACQTPTPYAAELPRDAAGLERNHGYALLYSTIKSETQVEQILIIKRPRREVADLLRDISSFARDAVEQLVVFAEADDSLGFDRHGLPHAEARTRDLITRTTSGAIMHSSGRSFEFTMLRSQSQALSYIAHLAEAVREVDDDEIRREYLADLARDANTLFERIIEQMQAVYAGDET